MKPLDFPDIAARLKNIKQRIAADRTQDTCIDQFCLDIAVAAVGNLHPRTAADKPDDGQPVLASIRAPHLQFQVLEVMHYKNGRFHLRLPLPRGGFTMRPVDDKYVTLWWPIAAAAARVDEAQLEKQEANHDRN